MATACAGPERGILCEHSHADPKRTDKKKRYSLRSCLFDITRARLVYVIRYSLRSCNCGRARVGGVRWTKKKGPPQRAAPCGIPSQKEEQQRENQHFNNLLHLAASFLLRRLLSLRAVLLQPAGTVEYFLRVEPRRARLLAIGFRVCAPNIRTG